MNRALSHFVFAGAVAAAMVVFPPPRSRPPATTVPTSSGQAGPRVGPSSLYPDPTLPYAVGALTSDGPVSAASISSKERPLVSKPMNQ
jgi:hypothetical protein